MQHTVCCSGLKGTMSEFELNLLRQRSLEAIRSKARRGELQFRLPIVFDGSQRQSRDRSRPSSARGSANWSSPRWWNWAAPASVHWSDERVRGLQKATRGRFVFSPGNQSALAGRCPVSTILVKTSCTALALDGRDRSRLCRWEPIENRIGSRN